MKRSDDRWEVPITSLEERVLYPSRWKNGALLLICLVFVAAGIWQVPTEPAMAWLTIVFFGACALVFVLMLHPRGNYLRLDGRGFEARSFFSTRRFDWSEIGEFGVARTGRSRKVAFNLAFGTTNSRRSWPSRGRPAAGTGPFRTLTGCGRTYLRR